MKLVYLLQTFDKKKTGYIDADELKVTMKELGMDISEEDVQLMMKQADCQIEGRIYYEGNANNKISFLYSTKCSQFFS